MEDLGTGGDWERKRIVDYGNSRKVIVLSFAELQASPTLDPST